MKRILWFILCLSTALFNVRAQNHRKCVDYDFSPLSFSMVAKHSIQPDLNTGTLGVTIPVYTWEDQDFCIPIYLHYSTNGFKPAQQTGVTGLGWNLPIGGVINRQIVGIDDLLNCGYYHRPYKRYSDEEMYDLECDFYYSADKRTIMVYNNETNSDIYHFNFLNHCGSFVIDDNKNFVVFDSNGEGGCYEISLTNTASGYGFMIKHTDGYQYYFGSDNKSREKLYSVNSVYYTAVTQSNDILGQNDLNTISWYLDKIVAPNGRELVFNYSSHTLFQAIPHESDDVCTTFCQGNFELYDNSTMSEINNTVTVYKHPSITTVSYLDSIQLHIPASAALQTIVTLNYSDKAYIEVDDGDNAIYTSLVNRQKKLDKVTYYNHTGEYIGDLSLSYTYNDTRMLLNQFKISSTGTYSLSYNIDSGMPGILTNALDFWGFYNGRITNKDNQYAPTEADNIYNEYVNKDYKNPDSRFSIIGTLKSIRYPTGGHTEFEYETNTASKILLRRYLSSYTEDGNVVSEGMDTSAIMPPIIHQDPFLPSLYDYYSEFGFHEAGGVRIKCISDYNDTVCVYKRTYSYEIPGTDKSSGIVLKFNRYFSTIIGDLKLYDPFIKFADNSLDKLHLAYSYVTEHLPDSSYTIYRFTDYNTHRDEFSPNKTSIGTDLGYPLSYNIFTSNISREPDSRHYQRGLVKSIEKYNKNGELTSRKEYNYKDSDSSYVSYVTISGQYYWSARHFTCDYIVNSIVETKYKDGCISTSQTYEYNSLGQMRHEYILDHERKNGNGKFYRYCYETDSANDWERQKKIPSDIIHTSIRDGVEYVVGNILLIYDPNTPNLNPVQVREYCMTEPIAIETGQGINAIVNIGRNMPSIITYYTYNDQNRLIRADFPGNSYTLLSWDAGMNQVLRQENNDPQQYSVYSWKDMIGLSEKVTPSGHMETYHYDSANRLKSVRDSDGALVRQYYYRYKHK